MVLASTLEIQPIASPSTWSRSAVAVSDGSAGQSMKMTAARSAMLPTAATSESSRLLPVNTLYSSRSPLMALNTGFSFCPDLAGLVPAGAAVPTYFRTQSYCSQPFSG